jgi:opacity protein-like surface antigen
MTTLHNCLLKLFLLPAILIIGCLTGYPQTFHGGITAGITASQVDGDSYAGFDKLGLQGGVFVSTALTGYLNAHLEIRYASRGARNPASEDNTGEYRLGLHYIDLPVLCALKIYKFGCVEAGLVPGYLFAAQGEDEAGELPKDYLIEFRKFDLGTLLGIRINLTEKISGNLRYSYSIFSIRDLESAGSYYSWFGKIFGHSRGDFNNYLTLGINYQIK